MISVTIVVGIGTDVNDFHFYNFQKFVVQDPFFLHHYKLVFRLKK